MTLPALPSWRLCPQASSPEANAVRSANESQQVQVLVQRCFCPGLEGTQSQASETFKSRLPVPTGLWVPWEPAPLVFKARCFGGLILGLQVLNVGIQTLHSPGRSTSQGAPAHQLQPRRASPLPTEGQCGWDGEGHGKIVSASPTCFLVAPILFAR